MAALPSPSNSTNVRNQIVALVPGSRGAALDVFTSPLRHAGYQVVIVDPARGAGLDAVVAGLERNADRVVGLVGHGEGATAVATWLARTRRDARAVLIAPRATHFAIDRVRAAALVIDGESGLELARAWPDGRFSRLEAPDPRNPAVVEDAVDFIARRVVFAPPPAPGAATFGAPAPMY
jgi:hypothetical protein